MSITYRLHPTLHLIVARMEGHITIKDMREYNVALRQEPRFTSEICDLVELVNVTTNITVLDWMAFKDWREQFPRLRCTAVYAPTSGEYGLARMYGQIAERSEGAVSVFRTREDAIAWLGFTVDAVNSD